MALPNGAMGWFAVCDVAFSDIFTYVLTYCKDVTVGIMY